MKFTSRERCISCVAHQWLGRSRVEGLGGDKNIQRKDGGKDLWEWAQIVKTFVFVLVFYDCVTNYHKLSGLEQGKCIISSLLQVRLGWVWILCYELKSRCQLVLILYLGSLPRWLVVERIHFLVVVGLGSPFSCHCVKGTTLRSLATTLDSVEIEILDLGDISGQFHQETQW